jgi:hypothetical protein
MSEKNRYVIHIPYMCYQVVESLIASFLTSLRIVPTKKQLLEAAIRFYPELPASKQKLYYSTLNASQFKDGYKTIRVSKETHSKAHKLAKRFGLSCSMFAAVALYSYYIAITNSTISEK